MYVRNAQLKYVLHMHDAQIYKRKSSIWKLLVDKHLFQEYRILKFYIDNKHNIVKKDVTEEFIFTEKLNLI